MNEETKLQIRSTRQKKNWMTLDELEDQLFKPMREYYKKQKAIYKKSGIENMLKHYIPEVIEVRPI